MNGVPNTPDHQASVLAWRRKNQLTVADAPSAQPHFIRMNPHPRRSKEVDDTRRPLEGIVCGAAQCETIFVEPLPVAGGSACSNTSRARGVRKSNIILLETKGGRSSQCPSEGVIMNASHSA